MVGFGFRLFWSFFYWSFWTGHFGPSFSTVIFVGHFRSLKIVILTQILAGLQWRYYQQLIVGIILLIVKIMVIPLIQDKIATALLVVTQNPSFS